MQTGVAAANAAGAFAGGLNHGGDEVVIVPNAAGVAGGVRAWTLEQYK